MARKNLMYGFALFLLVLAACTAAPQIRTIEQGRTIIDEVPTYINNTTAAVVEEAKDTMKEKIVEDLTNLSNRTIIIEPPVEPPIIVEDPDVEYEDKFGRLEVTVWDVQHEKPLYYARIAAIDSKTNFVRTTYTDSKGLAVFQSLPYGAYNLSAKKKEYEPVYGYAVVDSELTELRLEILDDPI